jgi:hypothetical protein
VSDHDARETATKLATMTAGDVDVAMRAELEARSAARLAHAELEVATAKAALADAQWQNAREALDAARVRFGVGWPAIRSVLENPTEGERP